MEADGVSTTSARRLGDANSGIDMCIDPSLEDPESWDCDCYEDMQERCHTLALKTTSEDLDTFYALCFRAQFCIFDRVCQDWKHLWCSSELQELQEWLIQGT